MNLNNYLPSINVTSQVPATILYKLLQNIPTQQNTLIVLSPPTQEDPPVTTKVSDNVHPLIKLEIDPKKECTLNEEFPASFNLEVFNSNVEYKSPTNGTRQPEKQNSTSAKESIILNPKKRLLQRHLLEKGTEDYNGSEISSGYTSYNRDAPFGRGKNGKPLTRSPFIPSYMDSNCGPFLCKVCGFKASGLHYSVMACEGCKGFFRRSVQKKLNYVCKVNNNCQIKSDNRTKCQQCRWKLCLEAGMDVASVLSEDERRTKNDLIRANRQKRNQVNQSSGSICNISELSRSSVDSVDLKDKSHLDAQIKAILETIEIVTSAYEKAFIKDQATVENVPIIQSYQASHEITSRVTAFATLLPGINNLNSTNQSVILKNRCLAIICLYTAFTYNYGTEELKLPSGRLIDAKFVENHKHIEPLWHFTKRMSEYYLTVPEKAVLTAIALLANNNLDILESFYNDLLVALDHLMPGQTLRNSKLLILIFSDLHSVTTHLFELQAPIGQQMLFDFESTAEPSKSPAQIVPKQSNSNGLYQTDTNAHLFTNVNATTKSLSSSSSLFAFSCGSKQL